MKNFTIVVLGGGTVALEAERCKWDKVCDAFSFFTGLAGTDEEEEIGRALGRHTVGVFEAPCTCNYPPSV